MRCAPGSREDLAAEWITGCYSAVDARKSAFTEVHRYNSKLSRGVLPGYLFIEAMRDDQDPELGKIMVSAYGWLIPYDAGRVAQFVCRTVPRSARVHALHDRLRFYDLL